MSSLSYADAQALARIRKRGGVATTSTVHGEPMPPPPSNVDTRARTPPAPDSTVGGAAQPAAPAVPGTESPGRRSHMVLIDSAVKTAIRWSTDSIERSREAERASEEYWSVSPKHGLRFGLSGGRLELRPFGVPFPVIVIPRRECQRTLNLTSTSHTARIPT